MLKLRAVASVNSGQEFVLDDGRLLSYDIYGDSDGTPVIFNHGLSDSRLIRNPDDELTQSLGVRVIAVDQPGVGGSSPQRGRRMVDWGADIEQLADHLQLDAFNVAGHSGGSPHALAIAHRLPDRVKRIVLASPVMPFDTPGVTKLLRNKDLKTIAHLQHLPFVIRLGSNSAAKKALKDIDKFIADTAAEDPSDATTFLSDPVQHQMFRDSFTAGLEQGGEGMTEMVIALWDWGFDISEILQPVTVFYGDADDLIDPQMPQQLAALLPNCHSQVWPGAGHYGFVDRERWRDFLAAAREQ